jgi:hypothetical protein
VLSCFVGYWFIQVFQDLWFGPAALWLLCGAVGGLLLIREELYEKRIIYVQGVESGWPREVPYDCPVEERDEEAAHALVLTVLGPFSLVLALRASGYLPVEERPSLDLEQERWLLPPTKFRLNVKVARVVLVLMGVFLLCVVGYWLRELIANFVNEFYRYNLDNARIPGNLMIPFS